MKNAIIALIGIAMVIMVTVGINTVENKTMRQNELDSNLDKALERTMEILTIDPVYQISKNDTEVAADFIENFLVNTTSDATFKIDIITVDPEKGLLDVQVSESYAQVIFTIRFCLDDKIIKQVNIHGGIKLQRHFTSIYRRIRNSRIYARVGE